VSGILIEQWLENPGNKLMPFISLPFEALATLS